MTALVGIVYKKGILIGGDGYYSFGKKIIKKYNKVHKTKNYILACAGTIGDEEYDAEVEFKKILDSGCKDIKILNKEYKRVCKALKYQMSEGKNLCFLLCLGNKLYYFNDRQNAKIIKKYCFVSFAEGCWLKVPDEIETEDEAIELCVRILTWAYNYHSKFVSRFFTFEGVKF